MYLVSYYAIWPLGGTNRAFYHKSEHFHIEVVSVALVKYESCSFSQYSCMCKREVCRHVWIAGLNRCTNHCTSQCTLFELAIWNHRKRLHTLFKQSHPLRCWSQTCGHSIKTCFPIFNLRLESEYEPHPAIQTEWINREI